MYFTAEFPANIESLALYEMVKQYKLNVTDIITKVYMMGTVKQKDLPYILYVCSKFGYTEITIKNPTN